MNDATLTGDDAVRKISPDALAFGAVGALVLLGAALRFWRLGDMPLFGDEAYYLLWADRLAASYEDHPAGIALLLKASTALGGRGEPGVRWLNAVLSTGCIPLAFLMGRRFVGRTGGLVAAAATAFAPVYIITGRVAYPDSLQYFLLLLNLLTVSAILVRDPPHDRWAWIGFGVTLALLLNVKLSSGFYAVALVLYALVWRRDLFRRPGLGVGAALAALGLIPVLAWNALNDWAMPRWQLFHAQGYGAPVQSYRSMLAHARVYHTLPVALLAALAAATATLRAMVDARAGREEPHAPDQAAARQADWKAPALAFLCLTLPVLLSRADSPRNLGLGLLPLWPLAGLLAADAFPAGIRPGWVVVMAGRVAGVLAVGLVLAVAVTGTGTAQGLAGRTSLPHGSGVEGIRRDVAGWPEFAASAPLPADSLRFAVDYSIAAQIAYYGGRPVHTSAAQYRRWGIPEADDLAVIALAYMPPGAVTDALRADFASVEGPIRWRAAGAGAGKEVYVWHASGRRVPMQQVLDDLDYLHLLTSAR